MRLPRSIDDRLKDAIVSFQFIPGVPPETVIGHIHALLKDKVKHPSGGQSPLIQFSSASFIIENHSFYLLTNDGQFRLDIDSQSITFNLVGDYAGWVAYRKVIDDCLKPLFEESIITSVTRLGVRYISQFDNIHILDRIRATIRLDLPTPNESLRKQIRFESWHDGLQAILTVVDGYPVQATALPSLSTAPFFSLIDLDVIHYFDPNKQNLQEIVFTQLEKAHQHEKTMFFQLLNDDFLQELNPVY